MTAKVYEVSDRDELRTHRSDGGRDQGTYALHDDMTISEDVIVALG